MRVRHRDAAKNSVVPKDLAAPVDILPQIAHGLKVDFLVDPSASRNEFTVHNTL